MFGEYHVSSTKNNFRICLKDKNAKGLFEEN